MSILYFLNNAPLILAAQRNGFAADCYFVWQRVRNYMDGFSANLAFASCPVLVNFKLAHFVFAKVTRFFCFIY